MEAEKLFCGDSLLSRWFRALRRTIVKPMSYEVRIFLWKTMPQTRYQRPSNQYLRFSFRNSRMSATQCTRETFEYKGTSDDVAHRTLEVLVVSKKTFGWNPVLGMVSHFVPIFFVVDFCSIMSVLLPSFYSIHHYYQMKHPLLLE